MKARGRRAQRANVPEPPEAAHAATQTRAFTVLADDASRRLDVYLAAQLPELSRTRVQELIREGRVRANHRAARASHRVAAGEEIEIEILERPALTAEAEDIPLDIIYQDDDLVVVNKAAGMVVHASAGHARGTLVNALLHRLSNLLGGGGPLRPGIVHRLDRGTSGVLVVARTDAAHRRLADQFRTRTVRKTYLALLEGVLKPESGSIQLPISRDKQRRVRMTARAGAGREARTDWRVLWRAQRYTLVEIELHTGPSWEIRCTARPHDRAPAASNSIRSAGHSFTPRASALSTPRSASPWNFAHRCRRSCAITSRASHPRSLAARNPRRRLTLLSPRSYNRFARVRALLKARRE